MTIATLFAANEHATGNELWVTDGTPVGRHLIADLNPGIPSSDPTGFTRVGNAGLVVFSAQRAEVGRELFVTDGTAFGTYLLKDIVPGTANSTPENFVRLDNGDVLFALRFGNESQIWITDGTSAGTRRFGTTAPDSGSFTLLPYVEISSRSVATNNPTHQLAGRANPNATVQLFQNDVAIGTVVADGNGVWGHGLTFTTDGDYRLGARTTDADGTAVTPLITYTFDTVAPVGALTWAGGETRLVTQTVTGTGEAGALVRLTVGGNLVVQNHVPTSGAWSLNFTASETASPQTLTGTITDAAGNSSDLGAVSFRVDLTPPALSVLDARTPDGTALTLDRLPYPYLPSLSFTLSGTGEAGASLVARNGSSTVVGTGTVGTDGSWIMPVTFEDYQGLQSVTVTATDAVGNSAAAPSLGFRYDSVAPSGYIEIISNRLASTTTALHVRDLAQVVTFKAQPWSSFSILDGSSTRLSVQLSDPELISTSDIFFTFTYGNTSQNGTVFTLSDYDGLHELRLVLRDPAGNSFTADPVLVVVDRYAPDVAVTSHTPLTTKSRFQTISGVTEAFADITIRTQATNEATKTAASTRADADGNWTVTDFNLLFDAGNPLQSDVRVSAVATDRAGNQKETSLLVYKYDIKPPIVAFTDVVADIVYQNLFYNTTNDSSVTVNGTAEFGGGLVEVFRQQVDTGGPDLGPLTLMGSGAVDAMGRFSVDLTLTDPGAEGEEYRLYARQSDQAGNVGTSTLLIADFDATAPQGGQIAAAATLTNQGSVRLDGLVARDQLSFAPLGKLYVKATGDFDPALYRFPMRADPAQGTLLGEVAYSAATADVWSRTVTLPHEGENHFVYAATDEHGNVALHTVIVTRDTIAPAVTIDPVPPFNTPARAISGQGEANRLVEVYEGATLLGSAMANAAGAWVVPVLLTGEGVHSIQARQTDVAGNQGVSAAVDLILDLTPPPVAILTAGLPNAPGVPEDQRAQSFSGTAEAGALVTLVDGAEELGSVVADPGGLWSLAVTLPGAQGTHLVRARATDAAGNASLSNQLELGTDLGDTMAGSQHAQGDTLVGFGGADRYMVDTPGDQVVEAAGGGADTVIASIDHALSDQVEALVAAGAAGLALTGNGLANTLVGGDGGDTLDGGLGADSLVGGAGGDLYVVDSAGDMIRELGTDGRDAVISAISFTLGTTIEDLALVGAGTVATGNTADNLLRGNLALASILYGGAGRDTLIGGNSADTLNAGTEADLLEGGMGNDLFILDATGDVVVELADAGSDTVIASVDTTLSDHVENLRLNPGAVSGTGNGLGNRIDGNGAANLLSGLDGADTLVGSTGADTSVGGAGDDLHLLDSALDLAVEAADGGTDTVSASVGVALWDDIEALLLTGAANLAGTGNALANEITGNAGNNALAGLAGADTLVGGAGADTLDGGTGADRLHGGAGNDLYVLDDAGDLVGEVGGSGADTLLASLDATLDPEFETLLLAGTGDIRGTGNAGDNRIDGNAGQNLLQGLDGADTLTGGAGQDTSEGGAGDDLHIVDSAADVAVEAANEGADTVLAAADFTLGEQIEMLVLTGSGATRGTGNDLANRITGNAGGNVLAGLDGADTLLGGDGDDELNGGEGADTLVGELGADTMAGGAGDDAYLLDATTDQVIELENEGADTVSAAVSTTLSAGVERLVLLGAGNLGGTGNELDNAIDGNAGANLLAGLDGGDTLDGAAGADTLDGGSGADSLAGGAGSDLYLIDDAGDLVLEAAGGGADTVRASVDTVLADQVETLVLVGAARAGTGNALANRLVANAAGNALDGGAGADTLLGGAGADTLDGGTGADTAAGGAGNDLYLLDQLGDVVTELAGGGADTVSSALDLTLMAQIEGLALTGAATLGTGNVLANRISAGAGAQLLAGLEGNDTIVAGADADTLDGGTGADSLAGGTGDDLYLLDSTGDRVVEAAGAGADTVRASLDHVLAANVEALLLTGGATTGTGNGLANLLVANDLGNLLSGGADGDTLRGGAGADSLDGGTGADQLEGGGGDDAFVADDVGDQAIELAGGGADTVSASVAYTLGAEVEVLVLTGTGNLAGTGNALGNRILGNDGTNLLAGLDGADTLVAGAGNDTVDGGLGADRMEGGLGADLYIVDEAGDVVVELAGGGRDKVSANLDHVLAAEVEDLVLATGANLAGTGNALANRIDGNAGDNALAGLAGADVLVGGDGADTLDGGLGRDQMSGGAGDDAYLVDDVGDGVTEAAGGGADTVIASVSLTLAAEIEALLLAGAANLTGRGNELANRIEGNAGLNALSGFGGADTLAGGAGADTLDGGFGADLLAGNEGNDRYLVDDAGDVVVELAGGGADTMTALIDATIAAEVERLVLGGTANLAGTGDAANNRIDGNAGANLLLGEAGADTLAGGAGADTLDGGTGADSLGGGAGDDLYLVDSVGDALREAAGGGADTVIASTDWILGSELDALLLTGAASRGTGNVLANLLLGHDGGVLLDGAAGVDTLAGGAGADTLIGGTGADSLSGGTGRDLYILDDVGDEVLDAGGLDTVHAGFDAVLADNLEQLVLTGTLGLSGTGNALANRLDGNAGANALSGLAGADTLAGGDGADTLDGGADADSLAGGGGNDLYLMDDAGDEILEMVVGGADTLISTVDVSLPANIELLVLTGAAMLGTGNDGANRLLANDIGSTLRGLDGADTLTGGLGRDELDGGAGADLMVGGAGDDIFRVEAAGDSVLELAGEGADTLFAAIDQLLGAEVEALVLTGAALTGTGNGLDNLIEGNDGANRLAGLAGDDVLRGGAGADTLEGGLGADSLEGGAGDDLFLLEDATDQVTEAAGDGADTVSAGFDLVLAAGIETLLLTGAGDLAGTGNESDNLILGTGGANALAGLEGQDTLAGGAGADTLDGGAGADSLVGGTGNDWYQVDATTDLVLEAAGGGADTIESSVNLSLGSFVEALVLTGAADAGTGNGLANLIEGNAIASYLNGAGGADTLLGGIGADTLAGGTGADSLAGGLGDDLYVVDDAGDLVLDAGGADTLRASLDATLADGIDALLLTGAAALRGTGNALDNRMEGNAGANLLSGGLGADVLRGGDGDDTLLGEAGFDTLVGEAGADAFRFGAAAEGADRILFYVAAEDRIEVSALGFGGLLAAGMDLAAGGRYLENLTGLAGAPAGTGQFIFDTDASALWWDADGTGAEAATLLVTLVGLTTLGAGEIVVIA